MKTTKPLNIRVIGLGTPIAIHTLKDTTTVVSDPNDYLYKNETSKPRQKNDPLVLWSKSAEKYTPEYEGKRNSKAYSKKQAKSRAKSKAARKSRKNNRKKR